MNPYRSKKWYNCHGYVARIVRDSTGTFQTVFKHREVMEEHLGRSLLTVEHVHHKNGDKSDNRLENLEVVIKSAHARLHIQSAELVELTCLQCQSRFKKHAKDERRRVSRGMSGPFCSKSCSGRWVRENKQPRNLRRVVIRASP